MEIIIVLIGLAGFAFTIIIHEIAHGLMAERLGDPTARTMGRITLNPIPHIDPIGSILVPLGLFLLHSPILFGWAKPVSVDPYNLRDPKKDMALVSLAGPLANVLFAIFLSIIFRVLDAISSNSIVFTLFYYLIALNIAIAVFNLIPIKVLDGGNIMSGLLPKKISANYDRFMNQFGLILIFLLILPIFSGNSLASILISPVINFILEILIPGISKI